LRRLPAGGPPDDPDRTAAEPFAGDAIMGPLGVDANPRRGGEAAADPGQRRLQYPGCVVSAWREKGRWSWFWWLACSSGSHRPVSVSCLNGNCAVFTATVSGSGSGVITSSGGAIDCTYANGATTGACSANLAIPVTTQSVTLDLTATPAAGSYACTVVGCGAAGQAMTFTTSFVKDETLSFSFIATKRVLSVAIGGDGDGAVNSSDAAINCPNACSAKFNYGSVVTLTASAKTGVFAGWGGACLGQGATCVVTMTDDRSVTASFATSVATPTSRSTPRPALHTPVTGGASGATPTASCVAAPSSSPAGPSAPAETVTPESSRTAVVLGETATPRESAPATADPTRSGSGDVPWLPIIVALLVVVGGVNLLAFQILRALRP
jgi:hypothetical protein